MKEENPGKPGPGGEPKHRERFLELMLSGLSHPSVPVPPPHHAREQRYRALREVPSLPGASYDLSAPAPMAQVRPDSPAIDVMTDLSKVTPITTRSLATVEEANRTMMNRGVRALFVVDYERVVLGIVTASDVLGEKPVQVAHQRGIRHDEVVVRDIMTPAQRLEAISFDDVLQARVGDVVATLRLSGRQHALVVERARTTAAPQTVRGIFSLTQIARQLGLPPQPVHDIGRTFAELMAALERGA